MNSHLLPWKASGLGAIYDAQGEPVTYMSFQRGNKANRDLILKCVNEGEALEAELHRIDKVMRVALAQVDELEMVKAQRDELVAVCQEIKERWDNMMPLDLTSLLEALDKIKGGEV